jgi:hypothetical protein
MAFLKEAGCPSKEYSVVIPGEEKDMTPYPKKLYKL